MKKKVKVLILEDNLYDAELNLEMLKKESWEIESHITDNEADFKNELLQYDPDIILSDYNMPQFIGIEALEIAIEVKPLTPFIIVTGSLDEETAVGCIKKGAWDYVLKEHLIRLSPAVESALNYKEEKTNRRNAEQKIIKSEELWRILLNNIDTGVFLLDKEFKVIHANNKAEFITTVKNKQLVNKNLFSSLRFINPEGGGEVKNDSRILNELFQRKNGSPERLLKYLMPGTNEELWLSISATTVYDPDQNEQYVFCFTDISLRKRHEAVQNVLFEIANSVNNTDSLVELFEFIRSTLGTVIDTRNCYIALYDSKTDTLSLPFLRDEKDSFTEFPAGKTLTAYVIRKGKAQLFNNVEVRKLEETGEVESIGSPSESWLGVPLKLDNKITGVFVVQSYGKGVEYTADDVQLLEFVSDQIALAIQRKKDQDSLRMNEERQRRIIESSPNGLVVIDKMGNIIDFNSNFPDFLYSDPETLKNMSFFDFVFPEDVIKAQNILNETLRQGYNKNIKFRMLRTDKSVFFAESSLGVINSNDKNVESFVIIVKNIDERIAYEENLKKAKMKAEEADRLKTAFLSNMSHEIRTPMNAIIGFAELLSHTNVSDDEKKDFIKQINLGADSLMRLIDDIIDIAKIESGQLNLNKRIFNLSQMFDELKDFFLKELIRKNKAHLDLIIDHHRYTSELNILTDEVRLKQVFSNLLSNAVKFTESGQIRLGILEITDERILFYVKDTGIGVRESKLKVIFDRFTQAEENKTKFYGGTGLGLAISKSLIELMEGEINVSSVPGEGALFHFWIPFRSVDMKEPEVNKIIGLDEGQWEDKKFLIVEDDTSNFLLLQEILKPSKAQILWARDGEMALKDFRKHKNIDIVLLDMQVPEKSGLDVVREMKKIQPKIPVIAQTAYALSGERQKSIEAGCDDYISKPLKISELVFILSKFFSS